MPALDLTDLNRLFNTPPRLHEPKKKAANVSSNKCFQEYSARIRAQPSVDGYDIPFLYTESDDAPPLLPDIRNEFRMCPILVERSKPFLDEFQSRSREGGRTWADVQANLTLAGHQPIHRRSTFPSTFNPNAAPFIPSRPLPGIPTPPPQTPTKTRFRLMPAHPAWYPAFCDGTRTTAARAFDVHAYELVGDRRWTSDTIAELAQHFCWRGAEGMRHDAVCVAPFARAVHVRLGIVYGEWFASEFTRWLQEYAVGMFRSIWKSIKSVSAASQPSVAYPSSALSLTAFIGDLFVQDLLPIVQVHQCLTLLLAQFTSLNHLHAIHLLLLHANKGAWRRHDMCQFLAALTWRVRCLGELKEGRLSVDGLGPWVDEIVEMVRRWQVMPVRRRFVMPQLVEDL